MSPHLDDALPTRMPRLVVGFDGRWQERKNLLARAAREAERRHLPLLVVTVLRRHGGPGAGRRDRIDTTDSTTGAWRALADAAQSLRLTYPLLPVRAICVDEDDLDSDRPEDDPLRSAALLAVGLRGQFRQPACETGSMSRKLLDAVTCPVLLVPAGPPSWSPGIRGHVLVGVGADPEDDALVVTALREAHLRRLDVHLLHADPGVPDEPDRVRLTRLRDLIRRARVDSGLIDPPTFSITLCGEEPAAALARFAPAADLLVVGTRPGSLSGRVAGSVSRALIDDVVGTAILAVPRPAAANLLAG
jgi:nucleotide-binding universal stress UspA family protein